MCFAGFSLATPAVVGLFFNVDVNFLSGVVFATLCLIKNVVWLNEDEAAPLYVWTLGLVAGVYTILPLELAGVILEGGDLDKFFMFNYSLLVKFCVLRMEEEYSEE